MVPGSPRETHNSINGVLIVSIFATDAFLLLGLPVCSCWTQRGPPVSPGFCFFGFLVGGLHSWLMYSLALFSLHEGAAHNLIFSGTGAWARRGQFFARNMCRIADGDPDYYARCHMGHHAAFGTEDDTEFLNFVIPRRYCMGRTSRWRHS